MIDFAAWSLNRTKIKIERYNGKYTDGVFVRTLETTLNVWGSAQPYKTIEGDLVPDPSKGENIQKPLILFTNTLIYMNDNTNPEHTVSDILTIDNRKWKPIAVDNWAFNTLPHYRLVLKLFDGF